MRPVDGGGRMDDAPPAYGIFFVTVDAEQKGGGLGVLRN